MTINDKLHIQRNYEPSGIIRTFPVLAEFHVILAQSEDLQPQLATEASLTPHKLPHNVLTSVERFSAKPKPSRVQKSVLDMVS